MANRRGGGGSKFAATPQGFKEALGFFSSIDSGIERVGEWDIKSEQFAAAILGLLNAGISVGLYTHWSGEQIVLRIYQGEKRDDHLVRDSMELDKLMAAVLTRLREQGQDIAE